MDVEKSSEDHDMIRFDIENSIWKSSGCPLIILISLCGGEGTGV
jgi:hypothetical protein